MSVYRKPKGVALISALLVVALATTAAVSLSSSMQLNLRRSANLYTRDQAWQYLLGVEEFGKVLLMQAIDNEKLDLLLGEERTLPVEGGAVTGRIIDLQAGINVNDLIELDADGKYNQVNADTEKRIKVLFQDQGIDIKHLESLKDWLDEDEQEISNEGAEDNYYIGLDPAYRAANGQIESLSELKLLREIEQKDLDALVVSPEDGKPVKLLSAIKRVDFSNLTNVNLNTAPEAVLKALEVKDPAAFIKNRPYGYDEKPDANDFNQNAPLKGMSFKSEYFQLEASAQIGRAKLRSFSIINIDSDNKMTVISRSFGTE